MRYDPDGKEKRRARKGERRCGECRHKAPRYAHWFRKGSPIIGACMGKVGDVLPCRADDCAGDCKHYKGREQG